jgi:hypothetical protein
MITNTLRRVPKYKLSTFVCVLFALALFSACNALESKTTENPLENEMAFWVRLNLDAEIIAKYKVSRAFVTNEEFAMIGSSTGPFDDGNGHKRLKVVVPENLVGTEQNFIIEFTREASPLDAIDALKPFPIALGILKSFYYVMPGYPNPTQDGAADKQLLIPAAGTEIQIPADGQEITLGQLKMGYGPKSISILKNIPDLPNLYKIELDLISPNEEMAKLIGEGYRSKLGLLTATDVDGKYDGFDINISDINSMGNLEDLLFESDNVKGICGGDDWYMVMTDFSLKKGDNVRVWVIFTQASNPLPRLFYIDMLLPEPFDTIVIKPEFAAIPIADTTFFQMMLMANFQGQPPLSGNLLPSPFDTFTAEEHYILIKKEYDFSKTSTISLNIGNGINTPPVSPWDPTPMQSISSVTIQTSDIFSNFKGIFDGASYTIKNISYLPQSSSLIENFGLFGEISGTVKNLNLVIADVSDAGASHGVINFGGLGGKATNAVIEEISVTSDAPPYLFNDNLAAGTRMGGIVGFKDTASTISGATQSVVDPNTTTPAGGLYNN